MSIGNLKYLVPNGFTALSLLLGLASIGESAQGDFVMASWMILWGVLLDKLDGSAARLLGASSGFGVQFDSFADFVAFGIAPAGLFYFRLGGTEGGLVLHLSIAVYVLAVASRLARFNISDPPMGDRIFYGLPTTLIGALLAAGYLTWDHYALGEGMLAVAPVYLFVSGVLMVSQVRLPKLKVRKSMPLNIFQFGNVLAAYVAGPLMLFPQYLFGLAVMYTVVGVAYCIVYPPEELDAAAEQEREQPA